MSVLITYFVHGTSVDNENGISSGWSDVPLSELGIKQAHELRKILDSRFHGNDRDRFDAVFCSDLKRATDTAHVVFGGIAPITADKRLRECNYGVFNGKPSVIVEPMQEKCVTERFPEGESYDDVKERIGDFLQFLRKEYALKHVALVGHKAPQLAIDVLLKEKSWEQAFKEDWRKTGTWQAGWEYIVGYMMAIRFLILTE